LAGTRECIAGKYRRDLLECQKRPIKELAGTRECIAGKY